MEQTKNRIVCRKYERGVKERMNVVPTYPLSSDTLDTRSTLLTVAVVSCDREKEENDAERVASVVPDRLL